ncbi:MAG: TonB-dependent receptor [Acidobacteria bacterium]|nr:TonB-dependent receptor [Acidobacteriota bacterium]
MSQKKIIHSLLVALMLVNGMTSALAQGTTSRITGVVLDPNGAVVPNAKVTLTNEGTQLAFTGETSSTGTYVFDSVQVGNYTVTVEKAGFKKFIASGNAVHIGQPTTVNITLELGQVAEVVEVRGSAELVQTSSSGNFGTIVEQRIVDRLPIVGVRGRNPLDLVNFQPGVVSGANTGGGVHVHGARDRAWNFTLDGIDTNETSAGGSNFSPTRTNPDSITEFKVITSNATAEYGRNSGAQVAMVTKSGTNDFHGNAFEFYQTPRFRANEYENNLNKVVKPQFVQHIPGFSFGGPVWIPKIYDGHNKTFFFTNMQWLRLRSTRAVTSTVYTQAARNGIFRYVAGGQNNPAGAAGASVDANGNVLPGINVRTYDIVGNDPARRGLDPTVQKVLGLTPLPNNFTVGDGLNTAGYSFSPIEREKQQDFVIKIDHIINQNNTVFGRYAQGSQDTIGDFVNDGFSRFPGTPRIVDTVRRPKNLALNWRWTPSASITNEAVFGLNKFKFDFFNPDPNFKDNPPFFFGLVTSPLDPTIGNLRELTTYQIVDNATWVRGAHTYKAGFNFRFQKHEDRRGSVAGANVQKVADFSRTINTVDPTVFRLPTDINTANDRPRLQSAINELLGRIGNISQSFVAESDNAYGAPGTLFVFASRYNELDYYVQDSWKLRPNLTIDLGLRYEVKQAPRPVNNSIILHPDQGVFVGATPSNNLKWVEGRLYKDDRNNFGPSIGIAWDPFGNGKTSIRANYRIAYDRINTFVISSTIYQSEPGLTFGVTNTAFGQGGGRLSDGLPTLAPPAGLTPTQLRQPPAFSSGSIHIVDPNWKAPRTQQWGLSLQREVGWKTVVELNYIGRKGEHLFGAYNINQAEIFSNGFVDAFKTVKAGGQSSLINQLLQPDPSRRANETGSDFVRRLFPTELSQNSVATLAATLARRTASGVPLPVASGLGATFFFPFPQFAGGLNVLDSGDRSTYHAFEAIANRRFSSGLSFQLSYTFAKSLDTRSFDPAFTRVATGAAQSASSTPFDIKNRELNYARSDFDRRHSFQGTAVYDLPFGKGRQFADNLHPVLDRFVGGWSLTGSVVLTSGRPFTVYAGSNTYSNVVQSPANCNGCSPDMAKRLFNAKAGTEFYFTEAQRALFSIPEPGQLGNTGRNYFTTPGFFNVNLAIGKFTRITENHKLEYRLEMQNATNHPSFGLPESAIITNSIFGRARGNTVSNARRIQMALKYSF